MRRTPVRMLLILPLMIVAACGTIARPIWETSAEADGIALLGGVSPTPVPPSATITATVVPSATLSPSSTPTLTPTTTATPIPPSPTAAPTTAAEVGDAANGETLFTMIQPAVGFACATCHLANSEERLLGPGLLNIGSRAETRVPGVDALSYIQTSIINPGVFVVADYPDGLMPTTWAQIYSEQEISDIIAYLLTLRG